jgi:hypothetical protein
VSLRVFSSNFEISDIGKNAIIAGDEQTRV